jgi:hypothetical protein
MAQHSKGADAVAMSRVAYWAEVRLLAVTGFLFAASVSAQGRFVSAGALRAGRIGHTATLLADGRVLVVGGRDGVSVLRDCEVFEPQRLRFRTCAPLPEGRANHSATLLSDGRVLIAGGVTSTEAAFTAVATTEVYEPGKDRWVPGPMLNEARQGHAAALLGTEVLLLGGTRERVGPLASTERLSPTQARVGPILNQPRVDGLVVLDDAGVLLFGGRGADGGRAAGSLAEVERCTLTACAAEGALAESRARHAVARFEGAVVVVGGVTPSGLTNYVEVSVDGGFALHRAHLPFAVSSHTATTVGRNVVVIGGESALFADGAHALIWKQHTNQWCNAGDMAYPRKGHTATALLDGRILVVGGTSGGLPLREAEVWAGRAGVCEAR